MDKSLVIQSLKDAYLFLEGAEKLLKIKRGEGYAAANPEIVVAYMLTAALNFHAEQITGRLDDLATSLCHLAGEP